MKLPFSDTQKDYQFISMTNGSMTIIEVILK